MKYILQRLLSALAVLAVVISISACDQGDAAPGNKQGASVSQVEASILATGVKNIRHAEGPVYSSGQPSREQLAELAAAGVKHVISLRPHSELDWDEAALAQSLGMSYHNIAVSGAADLSPDNAAALRKLLGQFGDEPSIVHCASGNRVGALAAIAASQQGAAVEEALAKGRHWGMTRLESSVRSMLESP